MDHYPRGSRYTALEKNVLKYRAFEMVLILHHVQHLRLFVVDSIRTTDRMSRGQRRLPDGVSRPDKEAWRILVNDGILTAAESREIQDLIDYRNIVAHEAEKVTVNVSRGWRYPDLREWDAYDRGALERLDCLRQKIQSGMTPAYVLSMHPGPTMFLAAESVYREELDRLRAKIRRQIRDLQDEVDSVNDNIDSLPQGLLVRLEPTHPRHRKRNNNLSREGVECCYELFQAGATPLTVAYLMKLSLRTTKVWFARWADSATQKATRK